MKTMMFHAFHCISVEKTIDGNKFRTEYADLFFVFTKISESGFFKFI